METHRIGSLRITVQRIDDKGAWLLLYEDKHSFAESAQLTPSDLTYERVFVPVPLWRAIEKLLTMRKDVEQVEALLMSDADWPKPTGDERTDLVAQRSAISSRMNEALQMTMTALRAVKR